MGRAHSATFDDYSIHYIYATSVFCLLRLLLYEIYCCCAITLLYLSSALRPPKAIEPYFCSWSSIDPDSFCQTLLLSRAPQSGSAYFWYEAVTLDVLPRSSARARLNAMSTLPITPRKSSWPGPHA